MKCHIHWDSLQSIYNPFLTYPTSNAAVQIMHSTFPNVAISYSIDSYNSSPRQRILNSVRTSDTNRTCDPCHGTFYRGSYLPVPV
jgi:hypothetical protein